MIHFAAHSTQRCEDMAKAIILYTVKNRRWPLRAEIKSLAFKSISPRAKLR